MLWIYLWNLSLFLRVTSAQDNQLRGSYSLWSTVGLRETKRQQPSLKSEKEIPRQQLCTTQSATILLPEIECRKLRTIHWIFEAHIIISVFLLLPLQTIRLYRARFVAQGDKYFLKEINCNTLSVMYVIATRIAPLTDRILCTYECICLRTKSILW